MIKEIVKDEEFLTQKSEQVSIEEAQEIITDLLDTANPNTTSSFLTCSLETGKRTIDFWTNTAGQEKTCVTKEPDF